MEGNIKSFLENKGYGFINGNDGKSYFFHISDVLPSNENLDEGSIVTFLETATPKGYKALKIKILACNNYYKQPIDNFHWSRKQVPSKYSVLHCGQLEFADESLENAREALKETALNLGFNSVVNVKYHKSTESSGNYKYSIHHFRGDCCLLAKSVACNDSHIIQEKNNENLVSIEEVKNKFQHYQNEQLEKLAKEKKSQRIKIVILTLTIIPFLIYFALGLWNTYQEELAIKNRIEQHQKK